MLQIDHDSQDGGACGSTEAGASIGKSKNGSGRGMRTCPLRALGCLVQSSEHSAVMTRYTVSPRSEKFRGQTRFGRKAKPDLPRTSRTDTTLPSGHNPSNGQNRISTVRQTNPCFPGANLTSESVRLFFPRDTYRNMVRGWHDARPKVASRAARRGCPNGLKWKVMRDGTMADSHFRRR
jgi:hypothetical protein